MIRLFALCILLVTTPAYALNVEQPLADAAQEARAKALFKQLRCVVCAGEAIADSPADVAKDMRMEVRRQIAAGKNDVEVVEYFARQYGDHVRMQPTFDDNRLLWFAPLLLLLLAIWLAWRNVFRGGKA